MWWERDVVHRVSPRSYADSNADGIGDLQGLISKLDHLEWLGVDALWLSPTRPRSGPALEIVLRGIPQTG
jgi:alpha-glucosidase